MPDLEVAQTRITEDELEKIRRYSEADLPNALQNEDGSERQIPHMPDDQPPEDYEGEDYQLDKALEFLNRGQLTAGKNPSAG